MGHFAQHYPDEFGQKVSAMMREGSFMADFRGLLRKFDDCPDHNMSMFHSIVVATGLNVLTLRRWPVRLRPTCVRMSVSMLRCGMTAP